MCNNQCNNQCGACVTTAMLNPQYEQPVDEHNEGVYQKFIVERVDGSTQPGGKHEHCKFYVLDLDHDVHALNALSAYADSCELEYPTLAKDLRELVTQRCQ